MAYLGSNDREERETLVLMCMSATRDTGVLILQRKQHRACFQSTQLTLAVELWWVQCHVFIFHLAVTHVVI